MMDLHIQYGNCNSLQLSEAYIHISLKG